MEKYNFIHKFHDATIIANHKSEIVKVNKQALKLFGYTTMLSLKINDLIYDKGIAKSHDIYVKRYLTTKKSSIIGESVGRRVYAKHQSGVSIFVLLRIDIIQDDRNFFIATMRPITEGTCIDDYQILYKLGEGNYSCIWAAKLQTSDRLYAIKIIDKSLINKYASIDSVIFECNTLRDLPEHPFTVKFYRLYTSPMHIYLIMDFYEGGSLINYIGMDEECIAFYGAQIILALEFLHSKSIYTRDIKPDNILIGLNGYIKIADYGIGTVKHNSKTLCGTPDYISPELISQPSNGVNPASCDIWAFGCTLCELLFEKIPWQGLSIQDTFINVIGSNKIAIETFDCSDTFKDLLKKLLEKNPEKRYKTVELRDHEFFSHIDFDALLKQSLTPPIVILNAVRQFNFRKAPNNIDYHSLNNLIINSPNKLEDGPNKLEDYQTVGCPYIIPS